MHVTMRAASLLVRKAALRIVSPMKNILAGILGLSLALASVGAAPPNPPVIDAKGPGAEAASEYDRLIVETGGRVEDRHLAALRKAAQQGHKIAAGMLGSHLVTERGQTDPDAIKEGVARLKRLENLETPEFDSPAFLLALCYLNGMGTAHDMDRAEVLLARTAPRGNSDMKLAYATFLCTIRNRSEAAKPLLSEVAKDATNPRAQQEAKDLLRSLP